MSSPSRACAADRARHPSRRQFLGGVGSVCTAASVVDSVSASSNVRPTENAGRFSAVESLMAETAADVLDDEGVAGAVVAVVDSNGVIHGEGYGHTTLDATEPISFEGSLFHIGSVVKAVTYTAAMALVDNGTVDIDTDVSEYLDSVTIPSTFDDPITLEHLATHTAGFEMRATADTASTVGDVDALPESLSNQQPSRIHPPGELPNYTNYAPALTGQLVADVVGKPFDAAVQDLVFDPLGIENATFDPSPDGLGGGPGRSVLDDRGTYSNVAPASGMSATGADMAQFLMAHLGGGATTAGRVLSPAATDEMHDQWYTPHEELDGIGFGLFERSRGETRMLEHSGSFPGFNADLVLIPEMDVGLFVAAQGDSSFAAPETFVDAFLDEYVPEGASSRPQVEPTGDVDESLTGAYRFGDGLEVTTYERAFFAVGSERVEVEFDDEGYLVVTTVAGESSRFVEIDDDVFRALDGEETVVFRRSEGTVTHVFLGQDPWSPMVPDHPLDEPGTALLATGTLLLVLGSAVFVWPGRALWRWYHGRSPIPDGAVRPGIAGLVTAGWPLLFVVAFLGLWLFGPTAGASDLPPGFGAVFYVPVLGAIATLIALGFGITAIRNGDRSLAWIHYLVVSAASAALIAVFYHWNLIGNQF